MSEHFNELTAAQTERLALLAEEAGEVIQIIGKILRHGLYSYHPQDPEQRTNSDLLRRELIDVLAAQSLVEASGDIKAIFPDEVAAAVKRKRRYFHHQQFEEGGE